MIYVVQATLQVTTSYKYTTSHNDAERQHQYLPRGQRVDRGKQRGKKYLLTLCYIINILTLYFIVFIGEVGDDHYGDDSKRGTTSPGGLLEVGLAPHKNKNLPFVIDLLLICCME